ncbi:Putrescine importer PuuP [Shewanella sp. OPT22]|nr:Putrescine importer PuuP [Shewanella sp. OPT22]
MKRVLSLPALTLFGLAYMSPLAAFVTYGIVSKLTVGHLSTAYLITLIAILFTAISYGRMSKAIPASGSAYIYTRESFGHLVGFIVGWTLLLDYLFAPMISYLVIGIYLQDYFPSIDSAVWICLSAAIVCLLNLLGIKLVTKVNLVLVGLQLIFVLLFTGLSIVILLNTAEPIDYLKPFYEPQMKLSLIISGAAILCLSFLGFESISTLAEEAIEPEKTVPKAIILCTVFSGFLYILVAYFGQLVFPHWPENANPETVSLKLVTFIGGERFNTFYIVMSVIGCISCAMASLASVSRVLYAMGRSNILPKQFGYLSKTYQTPWLAIIVVSLASLISIGISLELASSMISFGALTAFTFVNLSVIKHYYFKLEERHWFKNMLMPIIGFLLTIWLWLSLSKMSIIVGLCWLCFGGVYLIVQLRRNINFNISNFE